VRAVTQHCVEIKMGHAFSVMDGDGRIVTTDLQTLLIPFDDYWSAVDALRDVRLQVVEKSDTYKPQVRGEVVRGDRHIEQ
jgi:hypothetical protein